MTPKEAFKIGFLQKCASDGLSRTDTIRRIRDAKFMLVAQQLEKQGGGVGTAWNMGKDVAGALWPLLILGPAFGGMLGGKLLADAGAEDIDKDEMRKREQLAEYRRALMQMQMLNEKRSV